MVYLLKFYTLEDDNNSCPIGIIGIDLYHNHTLSELRIVCPVLADEKLKKILSGDPSTL
jgi:hypothetical protein